MALRPKRVEQTGDVPVEMLSAADPTWQTEQATRAWLGRYGLDWDDRRMHVGPFNRHESASHAWAYANGFTRLLANGYENLDWARLREAGVPLFRGDAMHELLTFIRVEDD